MRATRLLRCPPFACPPFWFGCSGWFRVCLSAADCPVGTVASWRISGSENDGVVLVNQAQNQFLSGSANLE